MLFGLSLETDPKEKSFRQKVYPERDPGSRG